MMALKQSLGARPSGGFEKPEKQVTVKEEPKETVLKMQKRLHESLLAPANRSRLLQRTGLMAAGLNEEGLVVLRGNSQQGLQKALTTLRRIAYHCQWGCSADKVAALLADPPARPISTTVVRLAATSSKLQSHESRL